MIYCAPMRAAYKAPNICTLHRGWYRMVNFKQIRSQWLRGLGRRSVAACLLILWVRIPLEVWVSVCYECCVLSGRGLCDGLINPPEESYRLWCVVVCDLESSWMRRLWPTGDCCGEKKKNTIGKRDVADSITWEFFFLCQGRNVGRIRTR